MRALILAAAISISTHAYSDEIVKTFEGSNMHTTRPFEVEAAWEIQWEAQGDIFQIFLYEGDGNLVGVPANQSGSGNGSAYQPKPGSYYLQINALGDWEVKIVTIN